MICPQCQKPMDTVRSGDGTINKCGQCSGTWVSGKSLHAFFKHYDNASNVEEAFEEILELEFRSGDRHCPACKNQRLKEVDIDDVELDYCTSCKGLFFDQGELEIVFPETRGSAPSASSLESGKTSNFIGSILSWLKVDR